MTPEVEARLRLAEESIHASELLVNEGHFRFAVSRSYYAMFYVVEALHAQEGRSYSSHGGAIAGFGKYFVKAGRFDKRFHQYVRRSFEDRQRSDYDPMAHVSEERARRAARRAQEFLDAARTFLAGV